MLPYCLLLMFICTLYIMSIVKRIPKPMHKALPVLFLLFSAFPSLFATPTDTLRVTATVCDSIAWFGEMYSHDTVAQHWVTHEEGRDTVYILTLYVNQTVYTDIYGTACLSYDTMGQTYTTSGDYELERYQTANGCDSVVMLHLTIIQPPQAHAIIGDTLVCRGQHVTFFYPNDYSPEYYWYQWYFAPSSPMGTNVSSIVWNVGDDSPSSVAVGMQVIDVQHHCVVIDTLLEVRVCEESSPAGAQIVRKSNSNILICNAVEDPSGIVHYRWGRTDKQTYEEAACDCDFNYYQYETPINTDLYLYWVETYLIHGDVICRNRTYYAQPTFSGIDSHDSFDVIACLQGNRLLIQADNPSAERIEATLYDLTGKAIAQWDLGSETSVRRQLPFQYPGGVYLLSVQAGTNRHTTKIFSQR